MISTARRPMPACLKFPTWVPGDGRPLSIVVPVIGLTLRNLAGSVAGATIPDIPTTWCGFPEALTP